MSSFGFKNSYCYAQILPLAFNFLCKNEQPFSVLSLTGPTGKILCFLLQILNNWYKLYMPSSHDFTRRNLAKDITYMNELMFHPDSQCHPQTPHALPSMHASYWKIRKEGLVNGLTSQRSSADKVCGATIIEPNCVLAETLYFSCFIPNSQSLLQIAVST